MDVWDLVELGDIWRGDWQERHEEPGAGWPKGEIYTPGAGNSRGKDATSPRSSSLILPLNAVSFFTCYCDRACPTREGGSSGPVSLNGGASPDYHSMWPVRLFACSLNRTTSIPSLPSRLTYYVETAECRKQGTVFESLYSVRVPSYLDRRELRRWSPLLFADVMCISYC